MSLRIVHLSDIHFGGELPDAVEAAIGAASEFEPTVTVVTGDLTLNGQPREFEAARRWLDRLPKPRLVTPGNHDTPYWNLPLRAVAPFDRYRRYIGDPAESAFEGDGLSLRCVNSARGAQPRLDWSKGAMSISRVRGLHWGETAAASLKVMACHHPLVDIAGAPVTGGVHGGAAAAKALTGAGVELILTGHVHVPFVLPIGDFGKGCYAVGAGTLSHRLRGTPASFSTIAADDQAFEVTVMEWHEDGFRAGQNWRVPRLMPGIADFDSSSAHPGEGRDPDDIARR